MNRIAITVGAIFLPGVAAAHPEHGSGGDFGLLHLLTDPFHVGLTAVAVLGVLAARWWMLRGRAPVRIDE